MIEALTTVLKHQKELYAVCGACAMVVCGVFLSVTKMCIRRYKDKKKKTTTSEDVVKESPQWEV